MSIKTLLTSNTKQFLDISANSLNLNSNDDILTLATGPWAMSQATSIQVEIISKSVTMSIGPDVLETSVNNLKITIVELLPSQYRPKFDTILPIRVFSNGQLAFGLVEILITGAISIFSNVNGDAFANAQGAGFDSFSVSWIVET
ncbi:hypothetical protein LCGC14_0704720 [marine sediment metagenome]|uniref:Uncharacterized protein n=1 Tax=marine sediment metagenome TaxID=412755 RepID=A0A0F9QGX1_9ZZZZ|nr:hypothetical protein [archaeon]